MAHGLDQMTRIELFIRNQGRLFTWYAVNLGYKVKNSSSTFNHIVKGRVVPSSEKMVTLARLLDTTVDFLWTLDNETGKLKALKVGDSYVQGSTKGRKKLSLKVQPSSSRKTGANNFRPKIVKSKVDE